MLVRETCAAHYDAHYDAHCDLTKCFTGGSDAWVDFFNRQCWRARPVSRGVLVFLIACSCGMAMAVKQTAVSFSYRPLASRNKGFPQLYIRSGFCG